MRKFLLFLVAMLVAGQASAKTLPWRGTITIDLGALESLPLVGSGVATVNDDSVSAHLDTVRLAGGITASGTIPVTDPNTTGQISQIIITGTMGGKPPVPQTHTLTGISGGAPLGANTLPLGGFTRMCILASNCGSFLPLDNTKNSGATGGGVGGIITIGGLGPIRVSLVNGPWTLATVSGLNQTVKGAFVTLTRKGFVHGAGSGNSSTATQSGLVQLIAPQNVTTLGITGNSTAIALFMTMTLHFIPEPGLLLLLGSGIVGLGLIGRSRLKK